MAANYDLVLLHGPKYCGRNILCEKLSSPIHERVCPHDYFRDNAVGLRDVILQVISLLKKNKKVVVDDENAAATTRDSYIRMVHRKESSKTIASVKVLPANGRLQLLWSREYSLAENSVGVTSQELSVQDKDINKWFSEGNEDQISYCSNEVSNPCDDEGIEVFEKTIPLTVRSQYKFEVPALCMQWEGMLCSSTEEPCLRPEVVSICRHWSDVNTGGRIFVICDNTVGTSGQQEKAKHRHIMQSLVKQFSSCPVYMFCIESPADSGGFTKPPNPGILAFLQWRHHLNIHTKNSVYLYLSQVHKVMAETAGMPHLKMSRAVHQPSLVASSHVYSIPNIPPYLKVLDILPPENLEQKTPEIPGFCEISSFHDNVISMHLGYGRRECLFADGVNTITRFNKMYCEMASLATDTVSKFSKANSVNELEANVDDEKLPAKKLCLSRSLSSDRELPHWMMSDRKTKQISQSKSPKPSTSRADSTESTHSKYKRTEYVMTEVELIEIAEDILKQAGREDLIRSIQLRQTEENVIKKHVDSTTKKQAKEKGAKQSFASSMDVDDEDNDEDESSIDVPSSRCDIAPEVTVAKVKVTGPTSGVVPRGVVSGGDMDQVPSTSLLDDFLISENVRKRSPKKSFRKSRDTPSKNVTQSGHVHFCENSNLQRTNLFQNKHKKLTTKPDVSPNRNNPESESPPNDEHSSDSSTNIQERTESTPENVTETSERKLTDFSILDEIFS
ncbi:uncharacterized protein LOC117339122 isoform X2 [Pecten maximus]|uniref:uncharacterized protein LOC117339122 isoform X2 n=1 Tax=Pecten maximus TaxID=6579 RepID=UPI0014590912|nr:uncharacterized protein LOC117339122 isoform X2 [Pecten maximus]